MNLPELKRPTMRSRYCTWTRDYVVTLLYADNREYEADLNEHSTAF